MVATLSRTSVFSILTTVGVSVGGIGQDALTSNKFVEAGLILGHGVSSLFCGAAGSDCCLGLGVLQLGAEGFSSTWGLPVG